jgi:chorismate synthase
VIGCHFGKNFQVTVAGGSYQEGLHTTMQGVPPGLLLTEKDIYGDLLLRKPGADELSSPRKEPDLPVIYSGVNCDETIAGANNKHHTNGTPMTILIPNLDRHDIHVKQYQDTNRTPRPGHASYASFMKYGPDDDAIGAGIFSGRYTCTIVAAGHVAKQILRKCGIEVFSIIRELAGIRYEGDDLTLAKKSTDSYKQMRYDHDPFYQEIYVKERIHPDMRFLEKMRIFGEIEKEIDDIRAKTPEFKRKDIINKYGVHPVVNCPDVERAEAMNAAVNKISKTGDSAGGVVEVIATGLPVGLGEPVFNKLDAQMGMLLGIGAVKGVEIGAGFRVKDMTGSQNNDEIGAKNGKVYFESNNAGGITGGLSSGQALIARLAVKPTPTIDKTQTTIDKYTLETKQLSAITRRDPTIVARIWPVAECYTAMILLENLLMHYGYQALRKVIEGK